MKRAFMLELPINQAAQWVERLEGTHIKAQLVPQTARNVLWETQVVIFESEGFSHLEIPNQREGDDPPLLGSYDAPSNKWLIEILETVVEVKEMG